MKIRSLPLPACAMLAALALAHASHAVAPPRAAGAVREQQVPSRVYGHSRRVWVYTPPRFEADAKAVYPLIVTFDGEMYVDSIPLPRTLDSLAAAGVLPPCVAVMVDDSDDRLGDLANHERFASFLATDLLPWMAAHWRARRDPAHVLVTGTSAGGLAAAYAAFRHPDCFGIVLSQSGAFWRGNEGASEPWEWLTNQLARTSRFPVRFHLEVGSTETRKAIGRGPTLLEANRHLHEVLQRTGATVEYLEVPGGVHAPFSWAPRFAPALASAAAPWRAERGR